VIRLVLNILDNTLLLLPEDLRPAELLGVHIPGFGLVLALVILLLTGMLAANLFGRRLVELWEAILTRIPLVNTIYISTKQVAKTLLESDSRSFRHVVVIEYPRRGICSLGFQTGQALYGADRITRDPLVTVFVPTTPNPTSGFIVMVPEKDVYKLDISVEDAFKYIISLGVIVPDRPDGTVPPPPELAGKPADS
jgi:uncharacterized membrane protein